MKTEGLAVIGIAVISFFAGLKWAKSTQRIGELEYELQKHIDYTEEEIAELVELIAINVDEQNGGDV